MSPVAAHAVDGITLAQRGPLAWSTDTALARYPSSVVWDNNRWYRDLGVPWPYGKATRGDLRRAFLALDGPNSHRLTWCFTQLLDPEIKPVYDALPLGERLRDHYVAEMEMSERLDRAMQRSEPLETSAPKDFTDTLDNDADHQAESSAPSAEDIDADQVDLYPYSVLLLGTDDFDSRVLERWQDLLIRAARDRGVKTSIQLGVMAGQGCDWQTGMMGDTPTVFVDRFTYPLPETADSICLLIRSTLASATD